MKLQPFKLAPATKAYIWGGNKLVTDFDKKADGPRLAETWELSCHPDGPSIVMGTQYNGQTLASVLEKHPEALGSRALEFKEFPILIKLIDAAQALSVQVHPDDEYAQREEGEYGKTELWVVLDCEPDAELIYGFEKEISKEEFKQRIEDDTLLTVANSVKVKPGDVFFIEAGTLHAIGKGIIIAEIQQNSNITYRVYDHGRLGDDGKPRELHIDKALEVTTLAPAQPPEGYPTKPQQMQGATYSQLANSKYFKVYRYDVKDQVVLSADDQSFVSLLCTKGSFDLKTNGQSLRFKKGDSVFVPANTGKFECIGSGSILKTTV